MVQKTVTSSPQAKVNVKQHEFILHNATSLSVITNKAKAVSRRDNSERVHLSQTRVVMETTAPHGGYGSRYSGEARLFVRGLARESGWLALTGPREGRAGVTAALGSLGGLTPLGETHWPFVARPPSQHLRFEFILRELLLKQVRRLLWNSLPV